MKSTTVKRLFAVAGNICAFPECTTRLVEDGVIVGQVCHIRAREPGGPRYDPHYSDRDAFENLVLMCGVHHKIIDTKPDKYPTDRLENLKKAHEQRFEQPSEAAIEKLTISISDGSIVTSYNQQGGQTAHQITNIYSEPRQPPLPSLVPVADSFMTGADNPGRIDFYDFRIRLRNEGETAVRDFMIEVEVPNAYANQNHSSIAEVRNHTRGDVTLYRRRHSDLRDVVIYPGDTSDHVLLLDYQLRHEQYADVIESIKVLLYSADRKVNVTEYPVREFRNKDRLNQFGLA